MTVKGFTLGKFMPYHKGHELLIKTARSMCDELTVLVCSQPDEPINGKLRYEWLRDAWQDCRDVNVEYFDKPIQQAPTGESDTEFWSLWRTVISNSGDYDIVFGGEPYAVRLAEEVNARAVIVDRNLLPVSGSLIRDDVSDWWRMLTDQAKSYYQKRVTFLGPESTGKTTLANSMGSNVMTEYGRTYDTHIHKGGAWSDFDLDRVAKAHLSIRNGLSSNAGHILYEDTDVFATAVWSKFLTGEVTPYIKDLLHKEKHADLYLLLSPEVPWLDDGTRMAGSQDVREFFFDQTKIFLKAYGARFVVIDSNDYEVRAAKVKQYIRMVS